jgi:hypothetical protein
MASEHMGKQEDLGFECQDCGEVYAPGADMAACVNDGHYGGPLVDSALPFASPVHQD